MPAQRRPSGGGGDSGHEPVGVTVEFGCRGLRGKLLGSDVEGVEVLVGRVRKVGAGVVELGQLGGDRSGGIVAVQDVSEDFRWGLGVGGFRADG